MKTRSLVAGISFVAAALSLTSCQENSSGENHNEGQDSAAVEVSAPVALADVTNSQEFPDAQLQLGDVKAADAGDSVKLSFSFSLKNYELKSQTGDEVSKVCNNSDKGQHIHFILDNRPYVALYEPKHETTVAKNSEHYLLAFLSRSYHLSLKNNGAAVLYHFKVDEKGKLTKLPDPGTAMVFYSRPKGDYLGKDTKNVLFDFYVWNTSLGTDSRVLATINTGGKDTSFTVSEWKPWFLQNLAMGKSTITLSLTDKDGKKLEGPQTEVSRDINLSADEPLK